MKNIAMITAMSVFLLKLWSVSSYAAEVVAHDTVGPWSVTTYKDEFTDKIAISISNTGKSFFNSYNNEREPLLIIVCSDSGATIHIHWGGDIVSFKERKSMEMRIDNEPATKEDYSVFDNKAVHIGTDESAVTQIKSMFDNSELKARISIGDISPYTATTSFDISRLEEVIKPTESVCNW